MNTIYKNQKFHEDKMKFQISITKDESIIRKEENKKIIDWN